MKIKEINSNSVQGKMFQDAIPVEQTVQNQVQILENCIERDIRLSEVLPKIGMNYDSFRYAINRDFCIDKNRYYCLGDFSERDNGIPVISFFSGAGGLDLGLEAAGFYHVLLIESNPLFCRTIKHNRPHWDVQAADISNQEEMIELISRKTSNKAFDGLFVGGPPCQSFSIAANQRFRKDSDNFKRTGFSHKTNGNLLFDYVHLILRFRPRVFLIENVTGLIDIDGGAQIDRAYRLLEDGGYNVHSPLIIKAHHYYVPQQRVRLFIIGSRDSKRFLPPIPSSQPLAVCSVFNMPTENVENHTTREHSAESVLRYMMLDYGARDRLGRVDRLNPVLPSKTVIAGGSAGGGRSHLHPHIPRTLSVRESARIQTFPDDYVFLGSVARQFTQVGNAIPPVLAAQIGRAIQRSLL